MVPIVFAIVGTSLISFVGGRAWQAARTDRLLAVMEPEELRSLEQRVTRIRKG